MGDCSEQAEMMMAAMETGDDGEREKATEGLAVQSALSTPRRFGFFFNASV
jgi:hypothetical protein